MPTTRAGGERAERTGRAPRAGGWFGWLELRLRAKLTAVLVLAALVPMAVVATIAVGVVLGTLERGLRVETERQLGVGLNLVLRTVERLGDDAAQLSASSELSRALAEGKVAVVELLARQAPQLPSSLVQITDASGQAVADMVVGGDDARFAGLGLDGSAEAVQLGRRWSRRVTFDVVGDRLVMRAVAPIVDPSLALQGVVVLSVPLDGDFADSIRGALGTEVLIAARTAAGAGSTFRDATGARLPDVVVPASVTERIGLGRPVTTTQTIRGSEFEVAWTALVDHAGATVGIYGVAVDRRSVSRAKRVAFRSLAVGGAVALTFALLLATLLSRRIGQPIGRLHRGAVAIARGDLDHRIEVVGGDEIGELAQAFSHMTTALKENQRRLAARMREIVALHDAGRAMSSVIELGQVSRKVVDAVARTFDGQLCALWLTEGGGVDLALATSRARKAGRSNLAAGADAGDVASRLYAIAREVADTRTPLRVERAPDDARRAEMLRAAGIDGSLVTAPLERKGAVVGVILVARPADARPFTEADANLLATFADQAAAAIENARLYAQVVGASEELERKVRLRTAELTQINLELGKTLADLQSTQAQLILSERLAGLGLLVAGVAHEINSPSAAVRGSVEAMGEVVSRLTRHLDALAALALPAARREALVEWVETTGRALAAQRLPTGATVRRAQREVARRLDAAGLASALEQARDLAEVGITADNVALFIAQVEGDPPELPLITAGYLAEYVHLHRNVLTIHNAIGRIQRIVGALKTYSHLDQTATLVEADLHEGIETTLTILDYALRAITVSRSYGEIPRVSIFVDELNQVWTNLIQNAVQALEGHGTITIETAMEARGDGHTTRAGVVVRVIDDGHGIAPDVLPQIFQAFFTTKSKGEGTGLGLGIVKRIVEKHQGEITCVSVPGRTCFSVWLPQVVTAAAPAPTAEALAAELTGEMTVERPLGPRPPGEDPLMLQREVRETILCVDDEEGVLAALRLQLGQRFGHECEIATALSGPEALELLDELESDGERIAVVIADQIMPGMKGVDLLEAVDRRSPTTTKILLTGQAGLDAVVSAINRAHLNHYIHKPWDEANLHLAVENLLRQYRLADENRTLIDTLSSKNQTLIEMNRELEAKVHERTHELAEANSRLAQLAVTDGLTGLYNHRHFHERLALEVERSGRNGLPLCLLMLDVDHFKHYNDQHGHPSGDEVLRQLARLLGEGRRANDVVARYGGEEFSIILVETNKFTAAKLAERLRERIVAHPFPDAARQPGGCVSVSIGLATFPDDAIDSVSLIRAADDSLYGAKRAGRNRVVLAPAIAEQSGDRPA